MYRAKTGHNRQHRNLNVSLAGRITNLGRAGRKLGLLLVSLSLALSLLGLAEDAKPKAARAVSGPGPALTVDVGANRYPINPLIYGMNFAPAEPASPELRLGVTANRQGGNQYTRYNWQTDVYNKNSSYFFSNFASSSPPPDFSGTSTEYFVKKNQDRAAASLLTVPMIGWTPKSAGKYSFSVAKYGPQQFTNSEPGREDVGNGRTTAGVPLTSNDPNDANKPTDIAFQKSWISALKSRFGSAAEGGVRFYGLDNEPSLWSINHWDVHPLPVGYDELINASNDDLAQPRKNLTLQYARAIKEADPTAQILGPSEWGWCAYFYSAADGCTAGTDRANHGDKPLVEWYLEQLKTDNGLPGHTRLLDYFDLHYYPQVMNGTPPIAAPLDDNLASTRALRLRSTRSLWDATYSDESWIASQPDGPQVRLIPRMRQWANAYPGTKLALSEYSWGAFDSINGALTQADVLGIFGRERLDMANLWLYEFSSPQLPIFHAFRMYRNYDGTGKTFGDMSLAAASTDQGQLAVYAAQRSEDSALTLMVVNKTDTPLTSPIAVSGFQPNGPAQVYRYSAANPDGIVPQGNQSFSFNSTTKNYEATATYPAFSITLLVLPTRFVTVYHATDKGEGDGFDSFSHALQHRQPGQTIVFKLPNNGATVQVQGSLPLVTGSTIIKGGPGGAGVACDTRITLDGTGAVGDGLRLGGNSSEITGLRIKGFPGRQLVINSTTVGGAKGNKLDCVVISKNGSSP